MSGPLGVAGAQLVAGNSRLGRGSPCPGADCTQEVEDGRGGKPWLVFTISFFLRDTLRCKLEDGGCA